MTAWFVPGRLEVLGKHTDYAGGNSLLAAVDRGITVRLAEAEAGITASTSLAAGEVSFVADQRPDLPEGHWAWYVQAVIDRLTLNFGQLRPVHLSFDTDLPPASGMSSSSALVVAAALALIDHNGLRERPEWRDNIDSQLALAEYLACIENGMTFKALAGQRGVGTFGGSEDHTGMLCCHADQLTRFSFLPVTEHESVRLPAELSFVVAVSGVLAEKTGAARESYNQASLQAREIVSCWNDATGSSHNSIAQALASSEDAAEGLRAVVAHSPELSRRLEAFLTESEVLIPAALAALTSGDVAALGEIGDESQRNAAANLGNQIPQTNRLQQLARQQGALAAASFGAGFGGSVWALVATDGAADFAADWLAGYRREFDQPKATTLVLRPGSPARRL